jgi:hypothetical protein
MTQSEVPRTPEGEEIRALWAQACDAWTDGDARDATRDVPPGSSQLPPSPTSSGP